MAEQPRKKQPTTGKSGFRIGIDITTGRDEPVYLDLAGLAESYEPAPHELIIGSVGTGKTVNMEKGLPHTERGEE